MDKFPVKYIYNVQNDVKNIERFKKTFVQSNHIEFAILIVIAIIIVI